MGVVLVVLATHFLPLRPSKGNPPCLLHGITDQGIATSKLKSSLSRGWLNVDDINH